MELKYIANGKFKTEVLPDGANNIYYKSPYLYFSLPCLGGYMEYCRHIGGDGVSIYPFEDGLYDTSDGILSYSRTFDWFSLQNYTVKSPKKFNLIMLDRNPLKKT